MSLKIPLSLISPDLRFALASPIAYSEDLYQIGDESFVVTSCVPEPPAAPAYLRYADRDAELFVPRVDEDFRVEERLAERIHEVGLSGDLDDLALAVVVLDVVDSCFQESGLWGGNIYLVDEPALAAALEIAGARPGRRDSVRVMRELAALELAYLFPVAGKFRAGMYDGKVQYRLNGWGRTLGRRLAVGRTAELAGEFRERIGRHLADEHELYALFLRELDVGRHGSTSDLLSGAMRLAIPVLV